MPSPLSEPVLRALAGEARRDGYDSGVLIAAAEPVWPGDRDIEMEWGRVRIEPCISVLAVREVMTRYRPTVDELLVILTDREEKDVGQEVLARIWRQRLQRPSNWEAARQLFRVERLDPALADIRWLVDLLVRVAPARGYPPPPSGFLDVSTAWRTLLRHGLRLSVDGPTLADILRWGETEQARFALDGPAGQHLEEIGGRLAETVDPVTRHLLPLVAVGKGPELIPFGLICDVLWSPDALADPAAQIARVRFESPVGTKHLTTPMARSWAKAAGEVYRHAVELRQTPVLARWTARAEKLLLDLDARDLAIHSDVLPLGFDQRLVAVGQRLSTMVATPGADTLETLNESARRVEAHARAGSGADDDRVDRVRMSVRLARWLAETPDTANADLAQVARGFVRDGAWVDRAREVISHGETIRALADAYAQLITKVDERRRGRDLEFARTFAEWSTVEPTDSVKLLPIERVLDELVAPLARQFPVLLLVLDGLSYPEATRLESDFRALGWVPNAPDERGLPIVIAAIPTVTVLSRASLLRGRLSEGGQDMEREGFEGHVGLRAAGGEPPRLFHKRDLKSEQGQIAPEVRDAILETARRVVGVVVNAVDDHLEKGAQLRLADGIKGIRPLRPLLDAAAEAGRIVILASDHGHVLENGSKVRPAPGGGERWRLSETPPAADEVRVSGPRVLKGGGTIIAPGVETVRYVPIEKRGYHGGVTPQEVLCPLMVLIAAGSRLAGWDSLPAYEPQWWGSTAAKLESGETLPQELEPIIDADGQVVLSLDAKPPLRAPSELPWIAATLASPVLAAQREMAGRQALDDADVRAFLSLLAVRGGVVPASVLTHELSLPHTRLRTKLEALRRMLNVDGYAVLTIEADGTARLNIELLCTQFEVRS